MSDQQNPFSHSESATNLLQVQILQGLRDLESDQLGEIICAIETLQEVVVRGMRIEMDHVDKATNEIAAAIEAKLSQVPPELQSFLAAHVARLNEIGKWPTTTPPTIPTA